MSTPVIIIIVGLFIFWGHYLSGVFERRSIPDVLGLILIGLLIGPVFNFVHPSSFGKFGSLFSNLVLLFILFESGTDLKFTAIKESLKESAGVTVIGFFFTWISATVFCMAVFHLPILSSLFVGAALGGTSSAVVVGLIKKIGVTAKTKALLIMESAETDVFTLAIPLSILGIMVTGEVKAGAVVSQFISSLVISLILGVGGAFLWSLIVNQMPALKSTKFSTPAWLFILYGLSEYLHFSGPLTALSFGITIGNMPYIEPKLLERFVPNRSIVLPSGERDFFSELVFLLRTFFFVFIGISVQIDRIDWLLGGAALTTLLFAVRILAIKIIAANDTPLLDKAAMSFMIPKGLGAAVIATLPLQHGHLDGVIIQSICFSVILFSTLICVFLFFLAKKEISIPVYRLLFGRDYK